MLSDLGPYFVLEQGEAPQDRSWLTLAQTCAPSVLERHVEQARQRLSAQAPVGTTPSELRAVASTVSMGMFSRLLSPSIGAALVGTLTLRPDPATTWLGASDDGLSPLLTTVPLEEPDPQSALTGLAIPLLEAFQAHFHISDQVLYGNVAASVVGACGVVTMMRPELVEAAESLRGSLLSAPGLEGTGTITGEFIRNSCCLIYQLPLDYICSNCVLVAHETPTAQQRGEAMAPVREQLSRQTKPDFRKPPFRRSST